MRRLFAAFLLLSSCGSSSEAPRAKGDDGSLTMPPLAPQTGTVAVRIDRENVTLAAHFGVEEDQCETVVREGACASELCLVPRRTFTMVPDAGVIDVRTPDGKMHELVPSDMFYEPVSVRPELGDPPSFSFAARGADVPPFSVDVEAPGPLFAVALPGVDPRSPHVDLEIAREPYDAGFELVMGREIGPRIRCSFAGGPAVVPKQVLATLDRGGVVRASAFRLVQRRVQSGDFTIDARIERDRKDFELQLTPAEPSSDP